MRPAAVGGSIARRTALACILFAVACSARPAGPQLPNILSIRELDAGVHVAGLAVGSAGDVWLATLNYGNGPSGIIHIRADGAVTSIARIESFNRVAIDGNGIAWFTVGAGSAGQQPQLVRVDGSGHMHDYPLQPEGKFQGIAIGPDGAPWFANASAGDIGRISPAGTIAYYGPAANDPTEIIAGMDGNLWFTEPAGNLIGRLSPDGTVKEFAVPSTGGWPTAIASSSDGNVWFCETRSAKIGRVTPDGHIVEFRIPTNGAWPAGIVAARDGTLWFTELTTAAIGHITHDGKITEYQVPGGGFPGPIARASDGSLWFVSNGKQDAVLGIVTGRSRLIHFAPRTTTR